MKPKTTTSFLDKVILIPSIKSLNTIGYYRITNFWISHTMTFWDIIKYNINLKIGSKLHTTKF